MKDEHPEEIYELRDSHYYGGRLALELRSTPPYPVVIPRPVLVWNAYEGGSVELHLNWDEIAALRRALEQMTLDAAMELRDRHLDAYRYAEELGAP